MPVPSDAPSTRPLRSWVRDGKISRMVEYVDRKLAREAVGLRE
jgi:hypothetical protein